MIGPVVGLDPAQGVVEVQLVLIDLGAGADQLGDRPQPGGDPRRAGVDVVGQGLREHPRVELERLAVGIDVGAREQRPDQRRAVPGRGGEQLVDEAVLGLAQGQRVELRLRPELGQVIDPAVRRREDDGRRLVDRIENVIGPVRGRDRSVRGGIVERLCVHFRVLN